MINFLNFHCERKLKENRSYLGIQHAAFSTELVSFLPFDTVNILVVYLGYASFSIRCFLVYLFVISVYLVSLPIKKEKRIITRTIHSRVYVFVALILFIIELFFS